MSGRDRLFRIFISYARPDLAVALEAYERLRDAGFDPWLDKESLPAGGEWELLIDREIEEASIFLVLLSGNSVTREGFLQSEILSALQVWKRKVPGQVWLVPARIEKCAKHPRLSHLNWIDLFEENAWSRLIGELRALRGGSCV